jgi:U5 small nuclear ribonucleoprotein component
MEDCFYAYGRIISGTLHQGQEVKVMGENFNLEEEEDVVVTKASKLWIMQAGGRFKIQIDKATAGNWVAIEGIDGSITKTATVTTHDQQGMETFRKLEFHSESAI